MGGKSSKAPPPPNYAKLAEAQGEANIESSIATAKLSNPNVITPFGNQTVEYGVSPGFDQSGYDTAQANYDQQLQAFQDNPGIATPKTAGHFASLPNKNPNARYQQNTLQWVPGTKASFSGNQSPTAVNRADFQGEGDPLVPTVTQTLNPESQALYEQEQRISSGLGNIAEEGIGTVQDMLGTPFDMSQVPDPAAASQQGWDNAYNATMERNQPFMDRGRERLDNKLANQGIFSGMEAYTEAMRDQSVQENDFNLGAQQNATQQQQAMFGMDTQARNNAIQQQSYLRQLPLNELMALQSGTQIQSPQFQGYQGSSIAPPPIFQAGQAQYNAALDQQNASNAQSGGLMSGLMGLGSAGMGMAGSIFGSG